MESCNKNDAIKTLYKLCEAVDSVPDNFSEVYKINPENVVSQSKNSLLILIKKFIQLHKKSKDSTDAQYKVMAYTTAHDNISKMSKSITMRMLIENKVCGKSILEKIKFLFPFIGIFDSKSKTNTNELFYNFEYSNHKSQLEANQINSKTEYFANESESESDSDDLHYDDESDDVSVLSTWSNSSFHQEPEIFDNKQKRSSNKHRYIKTEYTTEQTDVSNNDTEKDPSSKNSVAKLKKVLRVLNDIENHCLRLNMDIVKRKEIIGMSKLIAEMKTKYYSQLYSFLEKE